jgi:Zn-dependent peptidase ImmA (M78 family)
MKKTHLRETENKAGLFAAKLLGPNTTLSEP